MLPAALLFIVPAFLAPAQPCSSLTCVDTLFRGIYELRVPQTEARTRVRETHSFLRTYCLEKAVPRTSRDAWVFPVRGYPPAAIGGSHGEGYRGARAYDFFDGNSHGGHPAHDVFIRDRDFDDLDDKTKKPVDILSISGGVVVCVNSTWAPDSMDSKRKQAIRGGIYVWIYDPVSDGLFYYAHLRASSCRVGQHMRAGDIVGHIGRSGKNAFPHRSPTHLHLMYLTFADGRPTPADIYLDLVGTGRKSDR